MMTWRKPCVVVLLATLSLARMAFPTRRRRGSTTRRHTSRFTTTSVARRGRGHRDRHRQTSGAPTTIAPTASGLSASSPKRPATRRERRRAPHWVRGSEGPAPSGVLAPHFDVEELVSCRISRLAVLGEEQGLALFPRKLAGLTPRFRVWIGEERCDQLFGRRTLRKSATTARRSFDERRVVSEVVTASWLEWRRASTGMGG